jgi:NTP pyrophosphatase (non-canonical NTP hydrolase)
MYNGTREELAAKLVEVFGKDTFTEEELTKDFYVELKIKCGDFLKTEDGSFDDDLMWSDRFKKWLMEPKSESLERFEQLGQRIHRFNADRDWDQFHSPSNLAKSISIEAAELLECFQWSDQEYNRDDVLEELADVTNYCIQMAQVLGVDLIDIINSKMDVSEKKYPVEKAKGVSTKYNKL